MFNASMLYKSRKQAVAP